MKETWAFYIEENGFEARVYIYGTEAAVRAYADTELKYKKYHAISKAEYDMVKYLRIKVYLAPEI